MNVLFLYSESKTEAEMSKHLQFFPLLCVLIWSSCRQFCLELNGLAVKLQVSFPDLVPVHVKSDLKSLDLFLNTRRFAFSAQFLNI